MPRFAKAENIIVFTYLLLLAVPFLPIVLAGQWVEESESLLGLEIVVWAAVWLVFKRPAWFHPLLLPAFLGLPVEIYLRLQYRQGISTHHLGILFETSPREAMEFLGNRIYPLASIFVIIILWWAWVWRLTWRTRALDWRGRSRGLGFVVLVIGAALWWYGARYGVEPSAGADDDDDDSASVTVQSMPKLPSWAGGPFELSQLGNTWPFGWTLLVRDLYQQRKHLRELSLKSSDFKFGAHQVGPAVDKPEIVVLIIGESSRYDRLSLNGYKRDTTPLLKHVSNLVSLADMITPVSATRLSVPVMLTRKPATRSLESGFNEKSCLSAYKEAGFKTWWLSNQLSLGEFDTPITALATEAEVVKFLNVGDFTAKSSFDQTLIEALKLAVADAAPKKLIVVHTLGNHWNYSNRYPPSFDKWKPSLLGVDDPDFTSLKLKARINNSYDNSMLYVDWFLAQAIAVLKNRSEITSLMYVSDHGDCLYDGTSLLAFHGHNTQYEFHIPALVWYSAKYQSTYPRKIAQLRKNKRARLSTENVFHTLLDMANLRYSTERLDYSFLSVKLKRHKRYVDSYGWSDYDNSTFKDDSREVIDKGKPLAQQK